jgi:hypothetical protein
MPVKVPKQFKPITLTQLKLMKEYNARVRFVCGFDKCKYFNGIRTIKEVDEHFKKEHLIKTGLNSLSARTFGNIKEINE